MSNEQSFPEIVECWTGEHNKPKAQESAGRYRSNGYKTRVVPRTVRALGAECSVFAVVVVGLNGNMDPETA